MTGHDANAPANSSTNTTKPTHILIIKKQSGGHVPITNSLTISTFLVESDAPCYMIDTSIYNTLTEMAH